MTIQASKAKLLERVHVYNGSATFIAETVCTTKPQLQRQVDFIRQCGAEVRLTDIFSNTLTLLEAWEADYAFIEIKYEGKDRTISIRVRNIDMAR